MKKEELLQIYSLKGLNGLHSALKKSGLNYTKSVHEFGLSTNNKAGAAKENFLNSEDPLTINLHYYSVLRGRKWKINILRGIQFRFEKLNRLTNKFENQ